MSEIKLEVGKLTPVDVWNQKDEWAAREASSQAAWQTMDDEERRTVLDIVDRAIGRLQDRLNEWVPYALRVERGDYIDVKFRIIFNDIEAEMKVKAEANRRQIHEAREATRQVLLEAGEDPDALDALVD